jgi:hypothetical protein
VVDALLILNNMPDDLFSAKNGTREAGEAGTQGSQHLIS